MKKEIYNSWMTRLMLPLSLVSLFRPDFRTGQKPSSAKQADGTACCGCQDKECGGPEFYQGRRRAIQHAVRTGVNEIRAIQNGSGKDIRNGDCAIISEHSKFSPSASVLEIYFIWGEGKLNVRWKILFGVGGCWGWNC